MTAAGLWSSRPFLHVMDGNSYITGLVHVGKKSGDGNVSDGFLEEHLLNGGRVDWAESREEQEKFAEATGLSRVPGKTSTALDHYYYEKKKNYHVCFSSKNPSSSWTCARTYGERAQKSKDWAKIIFYAQVFAYV